MRCALEGSWVSLAIITSPPLGEAQGIVMSMSVCLSVCLYISVTIWPNFTKFSVHVDCGRGSVLFNSVAVRCVLPVL